MNTRFIVCRLIRPLQPTTHTLFDNRDCEFERAFARHAMSLDFREPDIVHGGRFSGAAEKLSAGSRMRKALAESTGRRSRKVIAPDRGSRRE